MRIKAICIDAKRRPFGIPISKWVKEGQTYHICHIYVMQNQGGIQGCDISEIDLTGLDPYNCFRLSRFAINKEDLGDLIALIKASDEQNSLSEMDVEKYVNGLEKVDI